VVRKDQFSGVVKFLIDFLVEVEDFGYSRFSLSELRPSFMKILHATTTPQHQRCAAVCTSLSFLWQFATTVLMEYP
jgi:hypothetical protein